MGTINQSITLRDVQDAAARIRPHAIHTPLLRQYALEESLGPEVYLKAENLQRTGAFKFRGAFKTLASMAEHERPSHVITSSSGNHGQAVAAAGFLLGIPITVVMPENAVQIKVDAVKGYGAQVKFAGTMSVEREAVAQELGRTSGGIVIGSFDDPRIIAGQGTAGLEIMEQLPHVEVILAPLGGGGLLSGIAVAAKAINPRVRVIGVEPEGASDAYQSYKSGEIVSLSTVNTIADGLRTNHVGKINFPIIQQLVDDIVLVSDDEIRTAMRTLAIDSKLTVEPSGAVAVAALLFGKVAVDSKKVVAVISGGNVDPKMLAKIVHSPE